MMLPINALVTTESGLVQSAANFKTSSSSDKVMKDEKDWNTHGGVSLGAVKKRKLHVRELLAGPKGKHFNQPSTPKRYDRDDR